MTITQVTAESMAKHVLRDLELSSDVRVDSPTALAAAVIRIAPFLCPCTAARLARAVVEPMEGLIHDISLVRDRVAETIDTLIGHGDLFEVHSREEDDRRPVVYLAPPTFIMRRSGAALLLGAAPGKLSWRLGDLGPLFHQHGHIRAMRAGAPELRNRLLELGFIERQFEDWARTPPTETASAYLDRMGRVLEKSEMNSDSDGFSVLDSRKSVAYYRGRWTEPKDHTGRFVARRPKRFGSDGWCFVEMTGGRIVRIVDLPIPGASWRACDEAWRLQLAIDAVRGAPQVVEASQTGDRMTLRFFSPVPSWARRRWDAIGNTSAADRCLFAIDLSASDFQQESDFIKRELWIAVNSDSQRTA